MKQKLLFLALFCLSVILIFSYWPQNRSRSQAPHVLEQPAPVAPGLKPRTGVAYADRARVVLQTSQGKKLLVEAVTSPESITLGLSGRSEIGSDGMLFLFPEPHTPRFWMKEMRFSLDFIWLNGEKIVDLTRSVPPPAPNTPLHQLPTYSPQVPVDGVLEVTAGSIDAWQLKIGDTLRFQ